MDRIEIVGGILVEPSVIKSEPPDENVVEIYMEDIQSDDDTHSENSIKSEEQDVSENNCITERPPFIEDKEEHTIEGSQEDDEMTDGSSGLDDDLDCEIVATWEENRVRVKEEAIDSESTRESNENAILNCLNTRQKTTNNKQATECCNKKPTEKSDERLLDSLLSTKGSSSKYQLKNHQSTAQINKKQRKTRTRQKTNKRTQGQQTSTTKTKKATVKDKRDSLLFSLLNGEQSNKKNLERNHKNNWKSKNTQHKETEVYVKSSVENKSNSILFSLLARKQSSSQSGAKQVQDIRKIQERARSDDNTKQKQKSISEDSRTQSKVLARICGARVNNKQQDEQNNVIQIKEKENSTLNIKNPKQIAIFSNRNNENSDLLLKKQLEKSSKSRQVNDNTVFGSIGNELNIPTNLLHQKLLKESFNTKQVSDNNISGSPNNKMSIPNSVLLQTQITDNQIEQFCKRSTANTLSSNKNGVPNDCLLGKQLEECSNRRHKTDNTILGSSNNEISISDNFLLHKQMKNPGREESSKGTRNKLSVTDNDVSNDLLPEKQVEEFSNRQANDNNIVVSCNNENSTPNSLLLQNQITNDQIEESCKKSTMKILFSNKSDFSNDCLLGKQLEESSNERQTIDYTILGSSSNDTSISNTLLLHKQAKNHQIEESSKGTGHKLSVDNNDVSNDLLPKKQVKEYSNSKQANDKTILGSCNNETSISNDLLVRKQITNNQIESSSNKNVISNDLLSRKLLEESSTNIQANDNSILCRPNNVTSVSNKRLLQKKNMNNQIEESSKGNLVTELPSNKNVIPNDFILGKQLEKTDTKQVNVNKSLGSTNPETSILGNLLLKKPLTNQQIEKSSKRIAVKDLSVLCSGNNKNSTSNESFNTKQINDIIICGNSDNEMTIHNNPLPQKKIEESGKRSLDLPVLCSGDLDNSVSKEVNKHSNLNNIKNKGTLPKDVLPQSEVKSNQLRTFAAVVNDHVSHIIDQNKQVLDKLKTPVSFKEKTSSVNLSNNKTEKSVTSNNKEIERLQKGGIIKKTTVNSSGNIEGNKMNKKAQQMQDLWEQQINRNKQRKECKRPVEEIIILDSDDDTRKEARAKKEQANGTQVEKLTRNSVGGKETNQNKLGNMDNSMFLIVRTPQNQHILVRVNKDEVGMKNVVQQQVVQKNELLVNKNESGRRKGTSEQEANNKESSNNQSNLKQDVPAKRKEKNAFDSDSNSDDEDFLKKSNSGKKTSTKLNKDIFDSGSDENTFNNVSISKHVKARKVQSREEDVSDSSNSDWFSDNPDDLIESDSGSDSLEKECNGKRGEKRKRLDSSKKEPSIEELLKNRQLLKTRRIEKIEYTIQALDAYKCNHCQAVTKQNEIIHHIRTEHRVKKPKKTEHRVPKKVSCPHCQLVIHKSSLKGHILRMHGNDDAKEFVRCAHCDFKCLSKSELARHILFNHTEPEKIMDQMHKCDQCPKMFKSSNCLMKHKKFVHNKETLEKLKCTECSYECITPQQLKCHKNRWHGKPEDIKLLQCPECSFTTYFQNLLNYHLNRNHRCKNRFQCEKCAYQTKSTEAFKLHMINHMEVIDEKYLRHRCDKCDYKTYRYYSLQVHKLIHLKPSEIEYFYCYHCNFKSKRRDNLKKHVLKHNEGIFQCFICDFTTSRRMLLIHHVDKHSKDQQKPQED